VICGGPGISDAYYCRECTQEEKDRDGCPKIVNLGASKTDLFYERKKYGFKRYVLILSLGLSSGGVAGGVWWRQGAEAEGEGGLVACFLICCCAVLTFLFITPYTGGEVGDAAKLKGRW